MKDPFKPDRMKLLAEAALPVLIDRLGGSLTFSQDDRDAVATKYGGAVGVSIEELEPGRSFRVTLVRVDPATKPVDPGRPVS